MRKDEQLQVLKDLIQINTENGNELETATYIGRLFKAHQIPYRIDRFDNNRANLVAEIGLKETDDVLGITGHQDTVNVSDQSAWTHAPFAAEVAGDKLYGRGAADMKSGLAAQVIALIELHEQREIKGTLRFIATAGEEYGTPGANRLLAQGVADDLSALLVGEATDGQVVYAHSGSLNYRIKSYGQSAHSARPAQGVNAISGLLQFAAEEKALFYQAPSDPILGAVRHSITVIGGGEQVNTIPDYAELSGNVRPTQSFDNQQVIALIQNAIAQINQQTTYHLEFELIHSFRPVETAPNNSFVKLVNQAAADAFVGRKVGLEITNGATDASVFIKGNPTMPVVILGPDEKAVSHQVDEYTTLSGFYQVIAAYEDVAVKYFKAASRTDRLARSAADQQVHSARQAAS
ncbi:ArgE/DapE family deacylase [Lentilactobacillus farraginis]|nr:ArgE/DapE family deacylase [Lentilactobacillus farraginis]